MAASRRTVLLGAPAAAIAVAGSTFSYSSARAQGLRLRRSIADPLAANDISSLRTALRIMRGMSDGRFDMDLDSEQRLILWAVRDSGGDSSLHEFSLGVWAEHHRNLFLNIHGSWNFLPWHRAQILLFEATVAYLSRNKDFALPFWDPAFEHADPAMRRLPALLNQAEFSTARYPGASSINFHGRIQGQGLGVRAHMFESDFVVFGGDAPGFTAPGNVEGATHNLVHRLIGAGPEERPSTIYPMASKSSPADPAFWLHHCNVDRIWASWQYNMDTLSYEADPSRFDAPRYPSAWRNTPFSYPLPRNMAAPIGATPLAASLVDHKRLGYTYAPLYSDRYFDKPFGTPYPFPSPKGRTPQARETSEVARLPSTQIASQGPTSITIRSNVDLGKGGDSRWRSLEYAKLLLELEGPGIDSVVQVFVSEAANIEARDVQAAQFVGAVVPRGMIHDVDGHNHSKTKFQINVTDALAHALKRSPGEVTLTFMRVPIHESGVLTLPLSIAGSVVVRTATFDQGP